MSVQKCPECNAQIPEEVKFCPYCLHKFVDEKQASGIELKKSKKKMLIPIIIFLLVALIIIFAVFFLKNNGNEKDKIPISKTDFSEYVGIWVSEDLPSGQKIDSTGGAKLEIMNINDNMITFNLTSLSPPPQYRIAEIFDVDAKIDDGKVEFVFSDDGWMNKGKGHFEFGDDSITVNVGVTEKDKDSRWELSIDEKLKRLPIEVLDLEDLIGEDFNEHKELFGNGIPMNEEYEDGMDGPLIKYSYKGIDVYTNEDYQMVTFEVDYNKCDDNNQYRVFSQINGNTTYAVTKELLPDAEATEEGKGLFFIGDFAKNKDAFVKVFFEENNDDIEQNQSLVQKLLVFSSE